MRNFLNREHVLTWSQYALYFGLYGFLLFLPCSIAFSQMSLGIVTLACIIESILLKQTLFAHTPITLPLSLLTLIIILTTPFSVNIARSVEGLKSLLIFGIFFLMYYGVRTFEQLRKYTAFLAGCVAIAALYGVIQHYLEIDIFRFSQPISFLKHVSDDLTAPVRVTGFFSIYMTFSGQLAMTFPVMLGLFLSTRSWKKRVWTGTALMLCLLALFWTYTRSAWIGAVCALTVFGIGRSKKWLLFSGVLIVLAGLAMIGPGVVNNNLNLLREKDEERIYTWITTIDMIREYPFTGTGKRNYSRTIQEYRQRRYPGFGFSSDAHAHNNILQVAADSGILASLCFLWVWGVLFREMYRTCHRMSKPEAASEYEDGAKWLALGFLGALIAFFVQGFFEHNFGDAESATMMWLYAAFGLKLPYLARLRREKRRTRVSTS